MKQGIISLGVGAALVVITAVSLDRAPAQEAGEKAASKAPVTAWEYRALRIPDRRMAGARAGDVRARKSGAQDVLNELGAEGWELIAVRGVEATADPVFYFKRPKR